MKDKIKVGRGTRTLHSLVQCIFPTLTMTRVESLNAIKNLQEKLNVYKEYSQSWRERALSAERTIRLIQKSNDELYEKHCRERMD